MSERKILALKVDTETAEKIFSSLKAGEGRFGWSYVETADLIKLRSRIEEKGWGSLSDDEQKCYQDFLLGLKPNDYVIYVNVPRWGECTLARVTEGYFWRWDEQDFNHRFRVDPASVRSFDRNAAHPNLSKRLKLQGRWWTIYAQEEFDQLLRALESGQVAGPHTGKDLFEILRREIKPSLLEITKRVHHTHPNFSLEGLLAKVMKKVPGVQEVTNCHARGDHGADLIVEMELRHPLTGEPDPQTWLVQVKSYEGAHADPSAIQEIERAFLTYPQASGGLIVSTADESTPEFDKALEEVQGRVGRHIGLLIGEQVAAFLLRYEPDLMS